MELKSLCKLPLKLPFQSYCWLLSDMAGTLGGIFFILRMLSMLFASFADLFTLCLHLRWAFAPLPVEIVPSSITHSNAFGLQSQNLLKLLVVTGIQCKTSLPQIKRRGWQRLNDVLKLEARIRLEFKYVESLCFHFPCGIIKLLNYYLTLAGIHLPVPLFSHSHLFLLILFHPCVHLLKERLSFLKTVVRFNLLFITPWI